MAVEKDSLEAFPVFTEGLVWAASSFKKATPIPWRTSIFEEGPISLTRKKSNTDLMLPRPGGFPLSRGRCSAVDLLGDQCLESQHAVSGSSKMNNGSKWCQLGGAILCSVTEGRITVQMIPYLFQYALRKEVRVPHSLVDF